MAKKCLFSTIRTEMSTIFILEVEILESLQYSYVNSLFSTKVGNKVDVVSTSVSTFQCFPGNSRQQQQQLTSCVHLPLSPSLSLPHMAVCGQQAGKEMGGGAKRKFHCEILIKMADFSFVSNVFRLHKKCLCCQQMIFITQFCQKAGQKLPLYF